MSASREPVRASVDTFAGLPDPGHAGSLDELVERLRLLKVWAGDPSYENITARVNTAWTAAGRPVGELARKNTVADCFRSGRRRVNMDLVVAVVEALHPDAGYVAQWRQALRVIGGETAAAAQVRVQDSLPPDLAGFTGRSMELDLLREALHCGRRAGDAVVISAIAGMAGVGKTQLAVHAAHLLIREQSFDRVLFVNLRGFHPDPAQPPADPAAVLEGFLRLLGVPGHKVPHDLPGRAAAYRERVAGTRTLLVLDNAATTEQVRPLLPDTPGCPVLVTSRRRLTDLYPATHLAVDVFTPAEARQFLTAAVPGIETGPDPTAADRIAQRCGYLPLALGLLAGHMRGTPGWSLSDHADRLDERHHDRRLDTGVQLALDLSYQHLPTDPQRLLRLAALHPGQDLDAYAAAALAGADLPTARSHLRQLSRDHLIQERVPGRYTFHDLVRAHAAGRATDADTPGTRRAALTRLFDYYLGTAAAAMDTLYPAEKHRRPRISAPVTPTPAMTDPEAARAWLDTECPTLVAVAAHTANHGWRSHTTRLSTTLFRYLNGGHPTDALSLHGHAQHAANHIGDPTEHAHALTNLGTANGQLDRYDLATDNFKQALTLFEQALDPAGQARALSGLGVVQSLLGRYSSGSDYHQRAMTLYRKAGDRAGEVHCLNNLAFLEVRLGRYGSATHHLQHALSLCRQTAHPGAEAQTLLHLGLLYVRLEQHGAAADHLQRALSLCRQIGDRISEAWTLDSLGTLHCNLGQPACATEHHWHALTIFREAGVRRGEASTFNGLGEAARVDGHPTDALTHHTTAQTLAIGCGDRFQQARAHTGQGHAEHSLGRHEPARHHYQQALTIYTDLGLPEADQVRTHLATQRTGPGRRTRGPRPATGSSTG